MGALSMHNVRPSSKPASPCFSSGPCKKRPGYFLANLPTDALGRSHRSKLGQAKLRRALDETRRLLQIPDDYLLAIVPGSDTGAFEMAMWNMLGPRSIDACYWEAFGRNWFTNAAVALGLGPQTTAHAADYGSLPDLSRISADSDVLFCWNGTTSGVCVPDGSWIAADRGGLTFNDATSAAFAMDIQWEKCDVTTFSWQKSLGGEGGHGMLVLSPRAVVRLEAFAPEAERRRTLPKLFRLAPGGRLDAALFEGATINTPSMLCVEDWLDAVGWAASIGGLPALTKRSRANLAAVESFALQHDWLDFLAHEPSQRSHTSVCLSVDLSADRVARMAALLDAEGVAYDVAAYREAPPGLRLWCGATVETADVEALMPWLDWAFHEARGA